MKNLYYFSLTLVIAALASNCEKEPPLITFEEVYVSPVYTQFEYRDTGQVGYTLQEYRLGSFLNSDTPVYQWNEWDKVTSRGPALLVDIRERLGWNNFYRFGLEFWATPGEEALWSEAHLKKMFEPGSTFSFGEGPGKVDLSFAHRDPDFFEDERSKASFLKQPDGQLSVTQTEDYSYTSPGQETVRGMLVHCTFEGSIGQYDRFEGAWLDDFTTNTALEIREGKATFFVAYR